MSDQNTTKSKSSGSKKAKDFKNLNGRQKAAIFLVSLGSEVSSDIFKPITVGINVFYGFNIIKWQYLFATSVFATIPVIVLFLCIEKHLVSGLTAGGVKG